MALQLDNFCGFETQGGEEASFTSGSPTYSTSTFRGSGAASLEFIGGGSFRLLANEGTTSAGTGKISSVWFRISATGGQLEFRALDDTGGALFRCLFPSTEGDMTFVDSTSTVDTATLAWTFATWHLLQIYWENTGTGNANVYIDGSEVMSATSADFDTGNALDEYTFSGAASRTLWCDDFACWSGATGVSEFLDDYSIKKYQARGTGLTEDGTALSNGTWDATGDTPLVEDADGTAAEYNGAAQSGGITTDAGTLTDVGPNTDTDVGTIHGGKWIHRLKRGTGSGTTWSVRIGNDVDGVTTPAVTVTGSYANFMTIRETAADTPTVDEYFRSGFGKSTGGRELFCAEMWAMLMFEPPAAAGRTTKNTRSHPLGQNIGMARRMVG